jgi:hypothetical protein
MIPRIMEKSGAYGKADIQRPLSGNSIRNRIDEVKGISSTAVGFVNRSGRNVAAAN